jgi:hypothetical protein
MTQTFEFYDARANEAAAEAAVAVLDNVRERALRSEKTWRALADQARRVLIDRAKSEAIKEARRAAGDLPGVPSRRPEDPADRTGADEFRDAMGRSLPPMPRERD